MSRLLFFAVVIVIVYWLLKSYRKPMSGKNASEERRENASGQAEDMVRCVHCGVHLPKHESILAGGEHFCSEAHRRAHAGQKK